jgi:hypothetical protein
VEGNPGARPAAVGEGYFGKNQAMPLIPSITLFHAGLAVLKNGGLLQCQFSTQTAEARFTNCIGDLPRPAKPNTISL